MSYIIPFLASLILAVIFTLGVKKIALYFNIVDNPDLKEGGRKIHDHPIPLLGGLAIFLAYFSILFLFSSRFLSGTLHYSHLLGFFIGALIIMIGGALDDKYNLKPYLQIIFPLLAIVAVIMGGVEISKITNPYGVYFNLKTIAFLSPLLISFWLLGLMYTTKLLDGVDGLVSGVSGIGAFVIFLFTLTTRYYQPDIAFASIVLVGATLGFLVFNWHPAKIFLGEGGSLLLGYILGVLAIISGGKIAIALLVMGIPVLDVAWTILRRLMKGKNPFRFADRKHLHHRLLDLGLGQRATVLIFYALSLIFGLSGLFLQSRGKFLTLLFLLLLMLLIIISFWFLDKLKSKKLKPSLLLHICCAPCATYLSVKRLMPRYDLTWYFYNSNLCDKEEYNKRLAAVSEVAKKFKIKLIIEDYNHVAWLEFVKGRENDPERGARCQICYRDRLLKTIQLAKTKKFDFFSTSLLVSPYKDSEKIKSISRDLSKEFGIKFLEEDFQSEDAYRKSQDLAKELGIYRQKFCGCEYSKAIFLAAAVLVFFCLSAPIVNRAQAQTNSTASSSASVIDSDNDGLNDALELKFKTDPHNPDSDGDGYKDGEEVYWGYNPLSSSRKKLDQKIIIDLKNQKLKYLVSNIVLKEFSVSSGKASTPTPKGTYSVIDKSIKAWSKAHGLWMPYWLGLDHGEFGIHELPIWPNGYREGAAHLGIPVSHGCIRLGIGAAQYIYDRIPVGTKVVIN